ncbi:GNAT family N-acetyltransferase [Mucilaginibacter sp.]|uniref:GNAT family N-acetyltransferase n=1 Tax=Mucilaginibacter sp. TaxID=1882438 RepID=UPI003D09BB9F
MSATTITLQKVKPTEADALLAISKRTFFDFFGPLNKPENMEAYAVTAFTPQKIQSELDNPDSEFYFALINDQITGYLKLNFKNAQTEFQDPKAMEVERIYVSVDHHKKNIGKQLLHFALNMALQKQMDYIWLGVWEHNHNAIGFYQHNGFEVFSNHEFWMGDDRQNDLLMKKIL